MVEDTPPPDTTTTTDYNPGTHGTAYITEWHNTPYYLGDTFHLTVGVVQLWLGLQAILANILVISFYLTRYNKIVPFMYLLIAACDAVTGISSTIMGIVFLILKPHPDVSLYMAQTAYGIYSITFKLSVFLNLAIAIIRSINIRLPFYRIPTLPVAISTAVYTVGWLAYTVWQVLRWHVHLSVLKVYIYQPGQFQGVFSLEKTGHIEECAYIALFVGLPYVVPSIIVVICMAIQVKAILKQRPDKTPNTVTQRKITITILMLTVLFFICNVVYIVFPIKYCTDAFRRDTDTFTFSSKTQAEYNAAEKKQYIINYLTGVVCPFLNAALNPVILIVRGEALSGFLKNKLKRLSTANIPNNTNISMLSIKNPNFKSKDIRRAPSAWNNTAQVPATCTSDIQLSVVPTSGPGYSGPTTTL